MTASFLLSDMHSVHAPPGDLRCSPGPAVCKVRRKTWLSWSCSRFAWTFVSLKLLVKLDDGFDLLLVWISFDSRNTYYLTAEFLTPLLRKLGFSRYNQARLCPLPFSRPTGPCHSEPLSSYSPCWPQMLIALPGNACPFIQLIITKHVPRAKCCSRHWTSTVEGRGDHSGVWGSTRSQDA